MRAYQFSKFIGYRSAMGRGLAGGDSRRQVGAQHRMSMDWSATLLPACSANALSCWARGIASRRFRPMSAGVRIAQSRNAPALNACPKRRSDAGPVNFAMATAALGRKEPAVFPMRN